MIDIIIATYNPSDFLFEQINSIIESKDFYELVDKIIISDDDSDIDIFLLVDDIKRKLNFNNIFVYKNKNKKGAQYNFIQSIKYSSSQYIMFCDQDDWWLPEKIYKSLNEIADLEKNAATNVPCCVYTDCKVTDSSLNVIAESFLKYQGKSHDWASSYKNLINHNVGTGSTMIFNQQAAKMLLKAKGHIAMHDWFLIVICSIFGEVSFLNEATMLYRQHEFNVVGARKYKFYSYININTFMIKIARHMSLSSQQANTILVSYKEELARKDKSVTIYLNKISEFKNLSGFNRIKMLVNGDINRMTVIRKVGLIFCILFRLDNK